MSKGGLFRLADLRPDQSIDDRVHNRRGLGSAKIEPPEYSDRPGHSPLKAEMAVLLEFCAAMAWNG